MFTKIKIFLQESRQEFKRVNWPTRKETTRYTLFVIGLSIALSIFLGVIDFIFVQVLKKSLIGG